MSIRDEPHSKIAASELADWLEQQGMDQWWTVDGDPLLGGRLSLPAPADELAAELRKIHRLLLVRDWRTPPQGHGERITARELDALVRRWGDDVVVKGPRALSLDNRFFELCWEGQQDEWVLLEDLETTRSERENAARALGSK
jgi:hypothetical protein